MGLHRGSDCWTNPRRGYYYWMVEKMEALLKEGYSSNQGFEGDSMTRGIRFQVNHISELCERLRWVRCLREPRERGNSPPLSPLEGKINWLPSHLYK
ncbi:hypothetical protein Pyn_00904 [Prunus yedoensis var. nudiflora]|uniref:Uncharacterized protein n=1 Tax=Prunus yedoensis var. nudiflora TaxID=2094558 RepID=A0A314XWT2_PRUYE|nr:hypothetical protein Pyn_00904 [Prunus yedoensis var. nudiflora]